MNLVTKCLAGLFATAALCQGQLPPLNSPPQITNFTVEKQIGGHQTLLTGGSPIWCHFPMIFKLNFSVSNEEALLITYSKHADNYQAPASTNDGVAWTFDPSDWRNQSTWTLGSNSGYWITSVVALPAESGQDEKYLATCYATTYTSGTQADTQHYIISRVLDSGGAPTLQFTSLAGTISYNASQRHDGTFADRGGFHFHRSMFVASTSGDDVFVEGPMFGYRQSSTILTLMWVRGTLTTSGGTSSITWQEAGTFKAGGTNEQTYLGEPSACLDDAGTGYLIVTKENRSGNYLPRLFHIPKTTSALTNSDWDDRSANMTSLPNDSDGADPCLIRLSNGQLMLTYGRIDNGTSTSPAHRLAFSSDDGDTWSSAKNALMSIPASTSYTGMVELDSESTTDAKSVILVTDKNHSSSTTGSIVGAEIRVFNTNPLSLTGYTNLGNRTPTKGPIITTGSDVDGAFINFLDENTAASEDGNVSIRNSPSETATFEAAIQPLSLAASGGLVVSFHNGSDASTSSAFHIRITTAGGMQYLDSTSTWRNLTLVDGSGSTILPFAPTLTPPTSSNWPRLRVSLPSTSSARIFVNDVYQGAVSYYHSVSTIDRVRLSAIHPSGATQLASVNLAGVTFYPSISQEDADMENGFEFATTGTVPSGYSQVTSAVTVVDTENNPAVNSGGEKALEIRDPSTGGYGSARKMLTSSSAQTVQLWFKIPSTGLTASTTSSYLLLSNNGEGVDANAAFRLIFEYNGGLPSLGYMEKSPAATTAIGSFTLDAWHQLSVVTTSTSAGTVSIDGQTPVAISKWHNTTTQSAIDRLLIQAGSTTGTAAKIFIDDVVTE